MDKKTNLKTLVVMAVFLLGLGCASAFGEVIYVDDDDPNAMCCETVIIQSVTPSETVPGEVVIVRVYHYNTDGFSSNRLRGYIYINGAWVEGTDCIDRGLARSGTYNYEFQIPSDAPCGTYTIRFYCYEHGCPSPSSYEGYGDAQITIKGCCPLVVTAVEPPEDFVSSGPEGGPFTPPCKIYTLTNVNDIDPLDWTATATCNWVDIIPSSGTLPPGGSNSVEVCINNYANELYPGIYDCDVIFTNTDSGYEQERDVTLTVDNVVGEIEVTDCIPEPNDHNMPFGKVVVGLSQACQITIDNIDTNPRHELTIEDIYLESECYLEDFDDGQAQCWQPDNPLYWGVSGGRYRVNAYSYNFYGYTQSLYTCETWKNATVEVTVDCSYYSSSYGDDNYAGVILRATDDFNIRLGTGSAYLVFIRGNRYYRVSKCVDGVLTDIKYPIWTYSSQLNFGTSNNKVKVVFEGSDFEVYFNSYPDPVWTGSDSDISDAGHIGLVAYRYSSSYYYDTYFYFDNVSICCNDGFNLTLPGDGPPWTLDANDPTLVVDVNFAPTDFRDYTAWVIIESDDRDEPNVVVHLSGTGIPDCLDIAPEEGLVSIGDEEGQPEPFTPLCKEYTLTNNCDTSLGWTATATCDWVDIIPSSGTLPPGDSDSVEVCINNNANELYPGIYDCNVIFTNTDSDFEQTRNVTLDVNNVLGQIKVTDSIPEPNDHNMPFGDVIVGLIKTEQVTITNIDPNPRHEVTIEDIYLDSRPYLEDFDDGQAQDWQSDNPLDLYWGVSGGRYLANAYSDYDFYGYTQSIYTGETWKNATVEVTVDCSYYSSSYGRSNNYAGVILRATDDFNIRSGTGSAYLVFIRGDRYYRVSKWIDGVLKDITYWTYSSQLNYGDYDNVIKAVLDGSDFEVYFNPNTYPDPVWARSDSDISDTGYIGLVAYRYSSSSSYRTYFYFDDVNVCSDDAFSLYLPEDGPPWTLDGGECNVVDVNFVPTDFIDYNNSEIVIKTNDPNNLEVRISMSGTGIPEYIVIVPSLEDGPTKFAGHPGGPFMPTNSSYVLTNNGPIAVEWSVKGPDWLDVDPNSGTLPPGANTIVTFWPNDVADTKPEGIYDANLIFIDETTTIEQERNISLVVYTKGKICVEPMGFDIIVPQGNIVTETLTIGNCGDANLSYTVSSDKSWLGISQDSGIVGPGDADQITVTFDGNREVGTHDANLSITSNDFYNTAFDIPAKMSIVGVDYFTELFDPNENDVSNLSVTFTPDGSGSYYRANCNMVSQFPVDPTGGTLVPLGDDDYVPVPLNGTCVNLYGIDYHTFYIGSNGFVTFLSGDTRYFENLSEHFELPRIAGLWDDLDPSSGGTVSWKQLHNRIAVTFESVPELYTVNSNSFQIEMFFDGHIRITWLSIAATDGLVGLSDGNGEPAFYGESDMSGYSAYTPMVGDLNNDFHVDFFDFAIFAQCWQEHESIMETVRDEFNAVDYSGNDGSLNWSNNWTEYGEVDGPVAGVLQVSGDGVMRIGRRGTIEQFNWSLTREADLGAATTATLRFDYSIDGYGNSGFVNVQVSDDGGFNWYTLAVYPHNAGSGSASYDISSWISSNTQIRFEVDPSVRIRMFFNVDNVEIEYGDPDQPWYSWCNGSDFNGNFRVDAYDLKIFCEHWLE